MRSSPEAAEIWDKTPRIFCGPQSTFLQHDPLLPLSDYTRHVISKSELFMLKFDRRNMPLYPPAGSALEELYGSIVEQD